ncbi:hypothetical protein GTQ99_18340, partial [Kineococcus sp. T13]|nr:hypothetical protein [Kineococcus vitellinus]
MATSQHALSLNIPAELSVGSRPVEVPVRRNGRRYGVLSISSRGVEWNPSTSRPPVSLSWEELPAALTAAAGTAEAAGKPAARPARGGSKAAGGKSAGRAAG